MLATHIKKKVAKASLAESGVPASRVGTGQLALAESAGAEPAVRTGLQEATGEDLSVHLVESNGDLAD